MNTPQESFHTLQEDWKHEIAEMFHELRCKEKVQSIFVLVTINNRRAMNIWQLSCIYYISR